MQFLSSGKLLCSLQHSVTLALHLTLRQTLLFPLTLIWEPHNAHSQQAQITNQEPFIVAQPQMLCVENIFHKMTMPMTCAGLARQNQVQRVKIRHVRGRNFLKIRLIEETFLEEELVQQIVNLLHQTDALS